ncbi:carbohydrate ABC transporter substrate-binding protein, CUT1 family [Nitrosomonas nitrosa]|uniref:Carbohydrate ABC transporter substrate-binding protein, CUT1 family n=1 Tax=Nitrosomonas nitrosa TaxID=52442 RepID=A0A1I4LKP9_9PROT|nr:carbohydrate ABC transporter substrate-binding protein, CUT1 family [Nitrosomonas nitrosa]
MKLLTKVRLILVLAIIGGMLSSGCSRQKGEAIPLLNWYVFNEPSGAFSMAARQCSEASQGAYQVELIPLPADTDQQREQLVRRLAAGDTAIDIIGMDVIWTAEFAQAKWILPWTGHVAEQAKAGRLAAPLQSATYQNQLWGAPFTTNAQLLWYRTDRINTAPETWDEMIHLAETLGKTGIIQAQGERYEGLTVFFISLLASAGGSVLDESGTRISLAQEPTLFALSVMARLANSVAADRNLATAREDQTRLAFESGNASFMVNYTFVWPSAQENTPEIAEHIGWARWPAVIEGKPSRFAIGGINLAVSAYSLHPELAFQAAACIASVRHQQRAAELGGLPPTIATLYDDPKVREIFPFADVLHSTLRDAVLRPQTPLYNDVSLAISRILHPMRAIDPQRDVVRLRDAITRALNSEGLL